MYGDSIHHVERASSLDGLRGMAAYMVVISHVSNATGLWGTLLGEGGGQVGVMIFFVLSGYLIGALYLDTPVTVATIRDYAARRIARVVPLFYFLVTASLVMVAISTAIGVNVRIYDIGFLQALNHYAFIWGYGVFWTIPVEMHFYALFIPLWWLYSKSKILMLTLTVTAIVAYWALPVVVPQEPRTFPFYAVFFLCGLLASRIVSIDTEPTKRTVLTVILSGCFLLPFLLYPNIYANVIGKHDWLLRGEYQQMWHDARYALAATLCLIAALCSAPVRAMLSHKIMVRAGAISYSVYLLHMPVIEWLARLTPLAAYPHAFLAAALAATTILALVTYEYLEYPMRRWVVRRLSSPDRVVHATASENVAAR